MSCTIFDFGGILMAICYDKLWKLLIDKKIEPHRIEGSVRNKF